MRKGLFFIAVFMVLPAAFALNLPSNVSMLLVCQQLQEMKIFENTTINVQDFDSSDVVSQIGLQNILDTLTDEQLAEMNLTREQLEGLTIEDLEAMGHSIDGGDFGMLRENPIFTIMGAINKTTTIDVYYNRTNCITMTAEISKGEVVNVTFGEYRNPPLYIKLDMIFIEEIIQLMSETQEREGISAILLYMHIGQKAVGAMFNGNLVVSPIWGLIDIFRAFQMFMEAG